MCRQKILLTDNLVVLFISAITCYTYQLLGFASSINAAC